jgi:MFS superfamily sulfate permease-like transporter
VAWAGELRGALNATAAMLPFVLSYGFIVFGAIGESGAPGSGAAQVGLGASVTSVVLGGLVLLLFSRQALPAASPSATSCLILGAAVLRWLQDPALQPGRPGALNLLLALAGATTLLAGLVYLLLGALRAGHLVRFVPQPVLAGFMNGVAALIVLSQLPPLLGVPADELARNGLGTLAQLGPASAAAGATALATAVLVWAVRRLMPRAPAALVALVLAALAVWLLEQALHRSGPVSPLRHMGALQAVLPRLDTLLPWLDGSAWPLLQRQGPVVLAAALLLALIGALESVLNLAAVDQQLKTRSDPNRMLLAIGAVNVLMGVLGGLPLIYLRLRALATQAGGGQSWRALLAGSALLALVFTLGLPLVALLPTAVVAGIVVMLAWTLVDHWTRERLQQWWRNHRRGDRSAAQHDLTLSLAVVAAVCGVTVFAGFVKGVAVGVVLAMLIFIRALRGSLVRGRYSAADVPSRRVHAPATEARLAPMRALVQVLELEGALFFGNVERLHAAAEQAAANQAFLVLDLRRITTLDASGAVCLARLREHLAERGTALLLAGVTAGNRHGQALQAHGVLGAWATEAPAGSAAWLLFADADRATEHAELALLGRPGGQACSGAGQPEEPALPLAQCALFDGLSPAAAAGLAARMQARTLAAGEELFAQGDAGDALYVLTQGSVSVLDRAQGQRFVSFSPGMSFGETAVLDGRGRTASAVADCASTVHALPVSAMATLQREDPALAAQLYCNLARHLSERLRSAAGAWRRVAG